MNVAPVAVRSKLFLGWLFVTLIAAFNLFNQLGSPAGPIWDENYYITSTARYETGTAQFASHPPLGLMLIAVGDYVAGRNAKLDLLAIGADKKITGEAMPRKFDYFGIRCASALAGVLAAGAFFLLMHVVLDRVIPALLFTSFFLFDTALIAQFRAAHLDAFQLLFVLLSFCCLGLAMNREKGLLKWSLAFGICVGLATMVRANGALLLVTSIGFILPLLLKRVIPVSVRLAAATARGVAILGGFLAAILIVIAAHLSIANAPPRIDTPAGQTDSRFLSAPHQDYLTGTRPLSLPAVLAALQDYQRFMTADLDGIGKHDANGSSPLRWIIGQKPITYRWDSDGAKTSYVMLVANPVGWVVSFIGVVASALLGVWRVCRKNSDLDWKSQILPFTLLLYWGFSMAAYQYLASIRVMYLYHYFIPLLTGWVLAAFVWKDEMARKSGVVWPEKTLAVLAGSCMLAFVAESPIVLHKPIAAGHPVRLENHP